MRDEQPFTREEIQLLESFVLELLSRPLLASDLGVLRWVVARQQLVLEKACLVVGQHAQRIQALEAELEALRW